MSKAGEERYVFETEWFDQQASLVRKYLFTYFPSDKTIEMVSKTNLLIRNAANLKSINTSILCWTVDNEWMYSMTLRWKRSSWREWLVLVFPKMNFILVQSLQYMPDNLNLLNMVIYSPVRSLRARDRELSLWLSQMPILQLARSWMPYINQGS